MSTTTPILRDDRRRELAAAEGQVTFTFDAPLWSTEDLVVSRRVDPAAGFVELPAGRSISLLPGNAGATVTFDVAPRGSGDPATTIALESRMVASRTTDVTRAGVIVSTALESELDRETVVLQELRRDVDRLDLASEQSVVDLAATVADAVGIATAKADLATDKANAASTSAIAAAQSVNDAADQVALADDAATAAAFSVAAAIEQASAMQVSAAAIASILSVKPTGSDIIVSSVAVLGVPVGDDTTGAGTFASPYLTVTKALSVATDGQMIKLNGLPSAAPTYTAEAAYGITVRVGIEPLIPGGAILTSGGATRILQMSADLWLGAVEFDTAGTIDRAIDVGVTTHVNLTLAGTRFKNIKTFGVYTSGANISMFLDDPHFESNYSTCKGTYYLANLTGGGVYSLTGYRADITAHGVSGFGAGGTIHAAVAGAVSVYLANVRIRQVASAAGVGSVYEGLLVQNVSNAVIVAPDIEMDMTALPLNSAAALVIQPSTSSPLDTSGFVVLGLLRADGTRLGRIWCHSPGGGYGILAGYETLVAANGLMSGGRIEGMSIKCSAATRDAAWHGILNGCKANTIIKYNEVSGSIVLKEDDGARVLGNVIYGCSGADVRLKGSLNAKVYHNTLVLSASAGSYGLQVTDNPTTGTVSGGWDFAGNIIAAPDGVNLPRFVATDAGNGGTYGENLYYATGTLDATAWVDAGVGAASLAAWQTKEPSASWGDPNFRAPLAEDYPILAPSAASGRVTPKTRWTADRNGAPAALPLSAAGAYEVASAVAVPATEQQLLDTVAALSDMMGRVNTPSAALPTADVAITGSAAITVAAHGSKNVKVTTGASDAVILLDTTALTSSSHMVSKVDTGAGKVIVRTTGGQDLAWLCTQSDWVMLSWWSGAWGAERWRIKSWRQVVRSSLASQPFPPLCTAVHVTVRNAGNGGAGGMSGAAGTARNGGGGGAAGAVLRRLIARASFGTSWSATIGAGGPGGVAGANGSNGGASSFATGAVRIALTPGIGYGLSSGAGGNSYTAAATYGASIGDTPTWGGTASATGAAAGSNPSGRGVGGGGGAGGGVTSANVSSAGQSSYYNDINVLIPGGPAGTGADGTVGTSAGSLSAVTSTYVDSETTTGGGAGGGSDTGTGGAGGDGYDGGGGGGGGAGITGGAGGKGGDGVVDMKWIFA